MAPRDDFDIQEDDEGNKVVVIPADQATGLRDKARQAEANAAAAAERDEARRELAFLKAGIDTDSPVGKRFAKAYDGEITTDAIKAAAAEIPGLTTPAAAEATATTAQEQQLTPEQIAAQQHEAEQTAARQALANGASTELPPEKAGYDFANEVVAEHRAAGRRDEVAMAQGIAALATKALQGDKTVQVQPQAAVN